MCVDNVDIEKKEAEKEMPNEIEVVPDDMEVVPDDYMEKKDKERKKKEKKDKKKKKQEKKDKKKKKSEEEENGDEIIDEEARDPEGDGNDVEKEADFWMPPAGERWDHDDGGDRWGSDSDSGPETDVGEEGNFLCIIFTESCV